MPYRTRIFPATKRRIIKSPRSMKTPYGLQVIEECLTCPLKTDHVFCNLGESALKGLDAISSRATYPKGAVLFVEGQDPRGVFVICSGRIKLSAGSAEGRSLILRIAEPGEIVGLPGTISNKPYEVTAEALEPTQANFIRRSEFVDFLRRNGDAALRVAEVLTGIYQATCREVRYLGLSGSAPEKLARFILDLLPQKTGEDVHERVTLTLTHEEIGEMIGATRETVTRILASFKRKKYIEIHGSSLVLQDRPGLTKVLEG
jgi:CRP/FNR family transcriptional regulator, cyclic AMP receptor protein